jgi:peptidyl-dipeptidase A
LGHEKKVMVSKQNNNNKLIAFQERKMRIGFERCAFCFLCLCLLNVSYASQVEEFLASANDRIGTLGAQDALKSFEWATDINDETTQAAALASEQLQHYMVSAIPEAASLSNSSTPISDQQKRMLSLIRMSELVPPLSNADDQRTLNSIIAKMESTYSTAQACEKVFDSPWCLDLSALERVMAESREENVLRAAFVEWRTASSVHQKRRYERFAALANEGARDIGFADAKQLWLSAYDEQAPDLFAQRMRTIWDVQIRPLYEQLHCYVRRRLVEYYRLPIEMRKDQSALPAHLLGNMWAQDWSNIIDIVRPSPSSSSPAIDFSALLRERLQGDKVGLVRLAEQFYADIGFAPLPETFWQRSLFVKPEDRDVVCHASAWDIGYEELDVRLKMCANINEEDYLVVLHELGHIHYYQQYHAQPYLFRGGANPGFHEAIGDAIGLGARPVLAELLGVDLAEHWGDDIEPLLLMALRKLAFLPFGLLIDEWRWQVFDGAVKPERYNEVWWQLRFLRQGVAPPAGVRRTEDDFDPSAKYHVTSATPYIRYFVAHLLQFQLFETLCEAAGHTGPLHTCSIAHSQEAGAKLRELLALGASKPWPETLAEFTGGSGKLSADALLRYFEPLRVWLSQQNADAGDKCGWKRFELARSLPDEFVIDLSHKETLRPWLLAVFSLLSSVVAIVFIVVFNLHCLMRAGENNDDSGLEQRLSEAIY